MTIFLAQSNWHKACLVLGSLSIGLLPLILSDSVGAALNTKNHTPQEETQLNLKPQANNFKLALPGYRFEFPRDFGAHPAYKTEWWYTTGNLNAVGSHRRFGYELTFFRIGMPLDTKTKAAYGTSCWRPDTVYMTHFALTDPENPDPKKRFVFTEKFNRGALGRAGAKQSTMDVWNEHWKATLLPPRYDTPVRIALHASTEAMAIDLILGSEKRPAIHGHDGVSQKANCVGCASHYYSLTRLNTTGKVRVGDKTFPVNGLSWLDQEFGSNQLTENQTGWDWFSLQLSNGSEVMLYQLRNKNGKLDSNSSGSWVAPTGTVTPLALKDFTVTPKQTWQSPHTKAIYPASWSVDIPSQQTHLTVTPILADQELHGMGTSDDKNSSSHPTYWEGACDVSGTQNGKKISGAGYVELTGYDKAFRQRL